MCTILNCPFSENDIKKIENSKFHKLARNDILAFLKLLVSLAIIIVKRSMPNKQYEL